MSIINKWSRSWWGIFRGLGLKENQLRVRVTPCSGRGEKLFRSCTQKTSRGLITSAESPLACSYLQISCEHKIFDSVCQITEEHLNRKMNSNQKIMKSQATNHKSASHKDSYPTIKMPVHPTDTQVRLNTLITCFTITVETLEILANSLQVAFLEAIANTTRSLLKNIEVNCSWVFLSWILQLYFRPLSETKESVLS